MGRQNRYLRFAEVFGKVRFRFTSNRDVRASASNVWTTLKVS